MCAQGKLTMMAGIGHCLGWVACAAVLCAVPGGCRSGPAMGQWESEGSGWTGSGTSGWPFAPVSIRVHQLSHVDVEAEGGPVLVCHVELADRWGDVVKGVGELTVEASRVDGGDAVRWRIDLGDPEVNAVRFDPVTRTYRLELGGVGSLWSGREWGSGGGGGGASPDGIGRQGVALRVSARLVGPGPDGRIRTLRDDATVVE